MFLEAINNYLRENKWFSNVGIEETNLIFTSRYGIKAISEVENLKLKKTYCVGKSTAEIAKQLGFKNICYPEEGNARSLINLISKDKDMLQ